MSKIHEIKNEIRNQLEYSRALRLVNRARLAWSFNHYARDLLNVSFFGTLASLWLEPNNAWYIFIGIFTSTIMMVVKKYAQEVYAQAIKEVSYFDEEIIKRLPACPDIHDG